MRFKKTKLTNHAVSRPTFFPDSVWVTAGSQELMSSAAWDRMSLQPAEEWNAGGCAECGQTYEKWMSQKYHGLQTSH